MDIYYYTGKVQLRSGSTICSATYANASVSVSPEYVTHRNILYNEINILKGYRISVDLEMVFTTEENNADIPNLIGIINSISSAQNGIDGLSKDIFVDFYDRVRGVRVTEIPVNKIESNISLSDYISNNMFLGQIFKLKFSDGVLYPTIPLWFSSVTLVNTVLDNVDGTVAIDF